MSLTQIRLTARNLAKIGGGVVLLSGGEPFLRSDLPKIVEIFVDAGLDVRLQTATSRFATEEKLRDCYLAGARDINVSIDSLELNKCDFINSVANSGMSAIEVIERIAKIFSAKSSILSLGTVMSQFNFKEIPAIAEFARRIGWYISIVPVHIADHNSPKSFRSYDQLFRIKQEDWASLDEVGHELIQMKKNGAPIFDTEQFIYDSIEFLKGRPTAWRKDGVCDSPDLYFAIRPDGALTTCCDYTLADPPYTYDSSFVSDYKLGRVRSRQDIQKIVSTCSGCQYGSYPEATLAVRSPRALFERIRLVLNSGNGLLSRAEVKSNFFAEIKRVRASHPNIYPTEQWMSTEAKAKLRQWTDNDLRTELMRADRITRESENRVRGVQV